MKIYKALIYCLLSSFLLAATFPNLNLSFLAWFAFLPLLFAIQNKTKRQAFWLSYLCGFIFFILTIYWLIHVTLTGLILLSLYLAFYFAFSGYFFVGFKNRYTKLNISLIIFLSCVWVILEYLRSHLLSGFPWALLGYSQYKNIKIIQYADITGSWGLSFFVIFVNLCLFKIISTKKSLFYTNSHKLNTNGHELSCGGIRDNLCASLTARQAIRENSCCKEILLVLTIFILIYSYGVYAVNKYSHNDKSILNVSLIQGNIPQEEKWSIYSREKIKINYLDLSLKAVKDSPDIIIWPETSYPEYIVEEDKESISPMFEIASQVGIPILFGTVYQKDNQYFNSAILLKGKLEPQIYKKVHLVPFGEYLPLRKYLFFLEPIVPIEDFSQGSELTIFKAKNKQNEASHFGVLICFEDTIADLSRRFVLRGADFLVNITNDAWFKKSSSPYQHLQASVLRAVENRVCILRAANTGVSCVIDNRGQIIKRLQDSQGKDIFVKGFITSTINKFYTEEIQKDRKYFLSFYTRYGDWSILFCIIYVFVFIIKILTTQSRIMV